MNPRIIYSRHYDIGLFGLERLHLFDSRKYSKAKLPAFLESITRSGRVGLAIYNAGTDIFRGDTLGGLAISANAILERDKYVLEQLTGRAIPTVMLPSGGYSRESYRHIAATIGYILRQASVR